MIKKILIANRGEIAVRIIRACQEMNIQTVAIYSTADEDALHVKLADEAYCVGRAPAHESYLNIEAILSIALLAKVDAIHPGYGFLAEDADFAQLCQDSDVMFIGPSAEAIRKMGIKDMARTTMKEAGVPIVPGSDGTVLNTEEAISIANRIGYPVIIKATAGGGGKGIRVARDEEELIANFELTQAEARAIFENDGVYLEKYIESFRHIEIQIVGDRFGNVVHLGERDCTIQRRMQKLVEETPSIAVSPKTRAAMGEAAVRAAEAVQYVGAGTVEFIYDQVADEFYFMEMNTRIQVEHTITEMVTGVDLIKEQIRIADGAPLSFRQEDIQMNGWSIECRINAEDPDKNFLPSPGTIETCHFPDGFGIRVDSAMYQGYTIPPHYDSMVAKLIVHARTREEAILKMERALREMDIQGIATTIPFHLKLFQDTRFRSGRFETNIFDSITE